MQTQIAVRRLERPVKGRSLGGVCAGLASYFSVDVALVRILFVVFTFAGGAAIPVYIVLWLLMPPEGGAAAVPGLDPTSARAPDLVGAILIIAGLAWLFGNLGYLVGIRWDIVWPVVIVGAGILLIARGRS